MEYYELAQQARSGEGVTDQDLRDIAPPGTLAISGEDFAALAKMEDRFGIHAARMASTGALVSVTDEIHRVERWLATARKDPQANSTLIRWLENELADVRMGKRQLEERLAVQEKDRQAKKEATIEARTFIYERGAQKLAGITRNEAGRKVLRSVTEYGMWGGTDAHGKNVDAHQQTGRGCPPDCPTQKNYFAEE